MGNKGKSEVSLHRYWLSRHCHFVGRKGLMCRGGGSPRPRWVLSYNRDIRDRGEGGGPLSFCGWDGPPHNSWKEHRDAGFNVCWYFLFIKICVCKCTHTHITVWVWRSEDNLVGLVPSFRLCGHSRIETEVSMLAWTRSFTGWAILTTTCLYFIWYIKLVYIHGVQCDVMRYVYMWRSNQSVINIFNRNTFQSPVRPPV